MGAPIRARAGSYRVPRFAGATFLVAFAAFVVTFFVAVDTLAVVLAALFAGALVT
jgi:hypothetical protein